MSKRISITTLLLLVAEGFSGQASPTQPVPFGTPAQPTPAVLNRMQRMQVPDTRAPAQQPPSQPAVNAAPKPATSEAPRAKMPQATPSLPTGAELQPANPPRISYSGGMLSVNANNSTLSEILSGIIRTTGARLEGTRPGPERVFGQFGPGTPRQVLNSLLSGSSYDFILLGSLENPGNVQRIVLSPHGGGVLPTTTATAPAAAAPPYRPNLPIPVVEQQDDNEGIVTPENEVAPNAIRQGIPEGGVPVNQQNGAAGGVGQPSTQPQVKTPQQLLEELQRLRQQQQQQPQQPPPNVPR